MATTYAATVGQKHCPGVASLGLAAHDLPATGEHFSANKSLKDGLAVRCRTCDNTYGKAWLAAKKAGLKFSAKDGGASPVLVAEATGTAIVDQPRYFGGTGSMAERAAHGNLPGYTTEVVDGTVYALPDGSVASTPEGQAALQLVNDARAAARRKRDAERQRARRAAAKEAATA